ACILPPARAWGSVALAQRNVPLRRISSPASWIALGHSFGDPLCRAENTRTRCLMDVREQRRFLAVGAMAVEPAAGADDRSGGAPAQDEGLTAAPEGLGTAVGEIWRDLLHDRLQSNCGAEYASRPRAHP